MAQPDLRIGIDVGGTHTDAVALDANNRLIAKTKVVTSPDVTTGINAAIAAILATGVAPTRVTHVMIGSTHATNAVLQRTGLRKAAVVRIGGPSSNSVRPLFGWPEDLRRTVSLGECIIDGGAELDGREITRFDADALARFLTSRPEPVNAVAITSVFAPVSAQHEIAAEEVVRRELGPAVHVSLSHEIGTLGLLERENATVLNEALVGAATTVAGAISEALEANGLGNAIVYFAQNDGTLMALDYAIHFPVLTIGSGPANSIRGAAYLTGAKDALVVDVGGTSTDVGVLVNGFPRESAVGVQIGGVRTNFRMPDLISIAIGGGSIVHADDGHVTVGPDSVGYRLQSESLIFGGECATLSDAAVAVGRASFGSQPPPAGLADILTRASQIADESVVEAIDRMKTSRGEMPLIVVGGGSVLLADRFAGISEVLRPDHYDVANAIGAAIGTVSGQVDRIFPLGQTSRADVIEEATAIAKEQAVRAGAAAGRVEIVDLEEIPLAYLTDPALRVRVKAAGPLGSL